MSNNDNTYTAFISYRHTALDTAVADKLQKQIENYKVPKKHGKRKLKVFRDKTDLPLTSNLSEDIYKALEKSEFLIILCSPDMLESKYCKQELDYFVKFHGGTDKVLTVLTNGNPLTSFPPMLLENIDNEVGSEPLAADIRTLDIDNNEIICNNKNRIRHAKRKLKTEYLRILAPILGVDFDTLYNREKRRRRKRIILTSALVVLFIALITQSIIANISKIDSKKEELNTYSKIEEARESLALLSYSLSLNSQQNDYASLNMALLLQNNTFAFIKESSPGILINNSLLLKNKELDKLEILSSDIDSQRLLVENDGVYIVKGEDGQTITQLNAGNQGLMYIKTSNDNSCWMFEKSKDGMESLLIFHPSKQKMYDIPIENENNPNYAISNSYSHYYSVSNNGQHVAISNGGYVYLYELLGDKYENYDVLDVSDYFMSWNSESLVNKYFSNNSEPLDSMKVYLSPDGKCVLLDYLHGYSFVNVSTHLEIFNSDVKNHPVREAAYSYNGEYVAVAHGTNAVSGLQAGGYISVYNINYGELIYSTYDLFNEPVLDVGFNQNSNALFTQSSNGNVRIFDPGNSEAYQLCCPLPLPFEAESCGFIDNVFYVQCEDGNVHEYNFLTMGSKEWANMDNNVDIDLISKNENIFYAFSPLMCFAFDDTGKEIGKYVVNTDDYKSALESAYNKNNYTPDIYLNNQNENFYTKHYEYEDTAINILGDNKGIEWYKNDELSKQENIKYDDKSSFVRYSLVSPNKNKLYLADFSFILSSYDINWEDMRLENQQIENLSVGVKGEQIRISNDGNLLAVLMSDSTIAIYDANNINNQIVSLRNDSIGTVNDFCFDSTGRYLLATTESYSNSGKAISDQGNLEIWSVKDNKLYVEEQVEKSEKRPGSIYVDGEEFYYSSIGKIKKLVVPSETVPSDIVSSIKDLTGYNIIDDELSACSVNPIDIEVLKGSEWGDMLSVYSKIDDSITTTNQLSDENEKLLAKSDTLSYDELLIAYEQIHEKIEKNMLDVDLYSISTYYESYIDLLIRKENNPKLNDVLVSYFDQLQLFMSNNAWSSLNIDNQTSFWMSVSNLPGYLYYTMDIDNEFIDIFNHIINYSKQYVEYIDEGNEDYFSVYTNHINTSIFYNFYMDVLLDKSSEEAFNDMDNAYKNVEDKLMLKGDNLYNDFPNDIRILYYLHKDNPSDAAKAYDEYIQFINASYALSSSWSDEDIANLTNKDAFDVITHIVAIANRGFIDIDDVYQMYDEVEGVLSYKILETNERAQKFGLRNGDYIVGINGKKLLHTQMLKYELDKNIGNEVVITVLRKGKLVDIKLDYDGNPIGFYYNYSY